MTELPIIAQAGNLPINYEPTLAEFADAFGGRLKIQIDGSRVLLGGVGTTVPTRDIGPYLINQGWMAWDAATSQYLPVGLGNISPFATLTQNRRQVLPDKDGIVANLLDVYVPRDTVLLNTATITPIINWGDGCYFIGRLYGNSTVKFTVPSNLAGTGVKITVVLLNVGTSYTVQWPSKVHWVSGTVPRQPIATAGRNATAIYTFRESNVTGASVYYGDSDLASTPNLTVTTGGPRTVPSNYGGGGTTGGRIARNYLQ